MQYAKIIFGLPIEGPFDYSIPKELIGKLKIGSRVLVPFGNQKAIGFLVGFSSKTSIKNIKSIIATPDELPLINLNLLTLAKNISEYYCSSWGQAIETEIPLALRKGKRVTFLKNSNPEIKTFSQETTLVHCLESKSRWQKSYLPKIKSTLENKKSAIILLADLIAVNKAENLIRENFSDKKIIVLLRNQANELNKWLEIKNSGIDIVIGTRSSLFAPLDDLGLIIIDNEESYGYKQDQVPHYHAREVAFMRGNLENAEIILGSASPSLESMQLVRGKKIKYEFIYSDQGYPEIKIIDMKGLPILSLRRNIILSKYLESAIFQNLNSKGKTLILLNRRGFATMASCASCGAILKCPRCNINLVFHYKDNNLGCHHCNYKISPPKICPGCNTGYIRYAGAGIEKIESEISRIFPQAKVKHLEHQEGANLADADIFIATEGIIKNPGLEFDLVTALSIDNTLNHPDLHSAQHAFNISIGLIGLTRKKLVIQTSLPEHHAFKALIDKNFNLFYDLELAQRKQLGFPPFKHLALIKLRGKYPDKLEMTAKELFDNLLNKKAKSVKVMSLNRPWPEKLRGNYYWQILLKTDSPKKLTKFLKTNLNKFKHSGIIVTVDVDPV